MCETLRVCHFLTFQLFLFQVDLLSGYGLIGMIKPKKLFKKDNFMEFSSEIRDMCATNEEDTTVTKISTKDGYSLDVKFSVLKSEPSSDFIE